MKICKLAIILYLLFLLIPGNFVFASTSDGTVSGYAWSDKIGWINFGATNGNAHITDTVVTGYAWNENTGRILLNPTNSGVLNTKGGQLSGYAWSEGTGWINFGGVIINCDGRFVGHATGDNISDINFNCDNCNIITDWRPSSGCGGSGGGGGGGGGELIHPPPRPPYGVLINNSDKYINNRDVILSLDGGIDAAKMAVSNQPDFYGAVIENYKKTKTWTIENGDGAKTVYVKFYTEYNIASNAVSDTIILDTIPPEIKITSIKDKYAANEEVVIGGTTEPYAEVIVLIGDSYGMFSADEKGEWYITLGKQPEGSYNLEFTPRDLAGNIGKAITASFFVEKSSKPPEPEKKTLIPPFGPILRKLEQAINPLIPDFLKIVEKPLPKPVVMIPKIAQLAFKIRWRLLPEKPIAKFVLAPLPQDIKLLAQKFPRVQKTFTEVGVNKVTDVQKIQNASLSLPGLTETIGLAPVNITAGKLALVKGIPVAQLSAVAKSKIPSNVVFSKAGGGFIDFNVALSINNKGLTEQRIKTVANSLLQLVVKPEGAVKRVRGYIIFKSKKPTSQPSFEVLMNDLAFSSIFSNPDVLMPAALSAVVPVEGAKFEKYEMSDIAPAGATSDINAASVEQRLVLDEFDYVDSGSGVYTATVQAPVVDGEYEIITIVEYEDTNLQSKEIKLITVVDPEGYIYEKNGVKETRILGAIVSIYWLNPDTKQYELWPAKNYQQENPQTTDIRGTYSFLVPDGYYYLKVDAPGYLGYDGKPFQVTEGSGIHINIELKTKFWFLSIVDWKTSLLIIVILLLLYNFYRDKRRERQAAGVKI
ncbi:MAG: carboxypeptidase-like regulatory domain-containing protein [Patescibacteria group bacterium]